MPVVPVVRFWSSREDLSRKGFLRALQRGAAAGFKRVFVQDSIADELASSLGIEIHADVRRADPERIATAVGNGALGIIAATEVTPAMRTLALDGASLIGNKRVKRVADWPVSITLQTPEGEAWHQADTWVLVAGGDSFTDRGVYDTVVREGKGIDYPFDGGTARVTGHGCCDPVFNDNVVPRYVLTGNKGAVRRLFKGAELAIANHEQPVTDDWGFHSGGLRFSGKPGLTRIFTRAGIDWLSLANNHIKDYGSDGIKDTRRILRQNGIAFGGAGKDLEQARRISYLDAAGTRLAIIPCLGLVKSYWAGPGSSGATPCLDRYLVPDIKEAKRKADFVLVFPHWGVEYTRQPLDIDAQARRGLGRMPVRISSLGGHSHVAGSIEDIDGSARALLVGQPHLRPALVDQHHGVGLARGDLPWRPRSMEMRLRPYIIHDTSQPNFLDPTKGEGPQVVAAIYEAGIGRVGWIGKPRSRRPSRSVPRV